MGGEKGERGLRAAKTAVDRGGLAGGGGVRVGAVPAHAKPHPINETTLKMHPPFVLSTHQLTIDTPHHVFTSSNTTRTH